MSIHTISRIALGLFIAGSSTQAAAERIEFYDGNNCRGRLSFVYDGTATRKEGCKWSNAQCRNDVA